MGLRWTELSNQPDKKRKAVYRGAQQRTGGSNCPGRSGPLVQLTPQERGSLLYSAG